MSETENSISSLIAKLSPKVLALIVCLALSLIGGLMTYTVATGGTVESAIFSLAPSSDLQRANDGLQTQLDAATRQITTLVSENQALQQQVTELAARPTAAAFQACRAESGQRVTTSTIDNKLGKSQNSASWEQRAAELLNCETKQRELQNNFHYKLIVLEQDIVRLGRFIATHIQSVDRVESYKHIQSVLQDVGCFVGEIDGNQVKTRQAVVEFQNSFNRFVPEEQQLKGLGAVGFGTLEALRSIYRSDRTPACDSIDL